MRRMVSIVIALFAAVLVVSLSTLSAQAQSAEQYEASDGTETQQNTSDDTAPDESASGADPIWQGVVAGEQSLADAQAARDDLSEEERLPAYSQVVDNTTKGAFVAPGWKVQRGSSGHGGSFVVAEGAKAKPARFAVKIPTNNDYAVYAWWSAAASNSAATRFGVETVSGVKWAEADQRRDGGMWVKLGTYELEKGRQLIQIPARSTDGGSTVADAVAVVRGEAAAPPEKGAASPSASGSRATTDSKAVRRPAGREVVRASRRHLGTPYGHSRCRINVQEDCTCHTMLVFRQFGYNLPSMPGQQWKYGRRVARPELRPGDLVFFDDTRDGDMNDAHDGVGIYSGRGMYISANSYFGRVVEKEMRYRPGYFGAKRLTRG